MNLIGYGKEIINVFDLLGNNENDITKAISYALAKDENFLNSILKELLPTKIISKKEFDLKNVNITFQQTQFKGITDIEIYQPGCFHIIVEAKKGFNLPTEDQLRKYADDLKYNKNGYKCLYSLSNNENGLLDKKIKGIPLFHITYNHIYQIANELLKNRRRSNKVLNDLSSYLRREVINMQDLHSNTVYVVPLSPKAGTVIEHDKKRTYHCPVGNSFLKEEVNYLGFRYDGKLQYINHVENIEYFEKDGKTFFKFHLGPDIIPHKDVRTGGNYRGTKFYCDIDLLLTSNTILEASRKTKERHK